MSLSRNVRFLVLSNIGGRAFSFLTFFFLSSAIPKDVFGNYLWALTYVTYFSILIDLGIDTVAIRSISADDKQIDLSTIIHSKIILSLVSFVTCLVLSPIIISDPARRMLVFLFSLYLFTLPFQFNWYFAGKARFDLLAYATILQSIAYLIGSIVVVSLFSFSLLPLAYVAGYLLSSVIFSRYFFNLEVFSPRFNVGSIIKLLKDSLLLGVSRALVSMYVSVDIIIIGLLLSSTEVANYGVAFKISAVFLIPVVSLSGVALPELSKHIPRKASSIWSIQRITKATAILSIMISGFLLFNARPILELLYGHRFENIVSLLALFSLRVFFVHYSYLFSNVVIASKQDKQILLVTFLGVLFNVSLNVLLIPRFGILGATVVSVFTEMISMIFYFLGVPKHLRNITWIQNPINILVSIVVLAGGMFMVTITIANNIAQIILSLMLMLLILIFHRLNNYFDIIKFVRG